MTSAPSCALASWTAARSVHVAAAVAQMPSPGVASTASVVLLTVKVSACAAATAMTALSNRATGVVLISRLSFALVGSRLRRDGRVELVERLDRRLLRLIELLARFGLRDL